MRKFILLLISGIILSSGAAFAQEEILILFDASLSMGDKINGVPKYQMAAEETKRFVSSLPDSQPAGLRIIGLIIDNDIIKYIQKPEDLCKASRLAVPIQKGSASDIKNALSISFPLGVTPLVHSIETALDNDFTPGAMKHIVLVTDGADACGGNLCSFIQYVTQRRNDLKIDVIAFGADAEDVKQLKCLASYTSGRMIPVSSAEHIEKAYTSLFSFKRYEIEPSGSFKRKGNAGIEYKNVLMEFNR